MKNDIGCLIWLQNDQKSDHVYLLLVYIWQIIHQRMPDMMLIFSEKKFENDRSYFQEKEILLLLKNLQA